MLLDTDSFPEASEGDEIYFNSPEYAQRAHARLQYLKDILVSCKLSAPLCESRSVSKIDSVIIVSCIRPEARIQILYNLSESCNAGSYCRHKGAELPFLHGTRAFQTGKD